MHYFAHTFIVLTSPQFHVHCDWPPLFIKAHAFHVDFCQDISDIILVIVLSFYSHIEKRGPRIKDIKVDLYGSFQAGHDCKCF